MIRFLRQRMEPEPRKCSADRDMLMLTTTVQHSMTEDTEDVHYAVTVKAVIASSGFHCTCGTPLLLKEGIRRCFAVRHSLVESPNWARCQDDTGGLRDPAVLQPLPNNQAYYRTYTFQLQRWRQHVRPKHRHSPIKQQGITTQKIIM
jgi:hypothetical protein